MKKLLQLIIVLVIISNFCFAQSIATQYTLGKKRVGDSVGYYATGNGRYIDKITTANCWWNLWDFTRNVYDTLNLRTLKKADSSISYTTRFRFDSTINSIILSSGVISINGLSGIVNITTTEVPEGLTNLYFTNSRFDARLWVDTPTILGYIKYLDGLKFKITDTSGKWQYAMGFLPYTKAEVNTIANLRLLTSDSNTYTGYISKAFYYANLPSSTTYTNGSNIGLSGNAFYLDTSANNAATKTDLLSYVRNSDTSNFQRKGDSLTYQTTYRSDTSRTNTYAYIGTSQALDVKYTDSNAIYFTKYRSDTMRTNFLAYIALKMNYTDSATMLAYYMRKNDSGIYYSKYRSDTERTNNLAYFATKMATNFSNATVPTINLSANSNMTSTGTTTVTLTADTTANHLATKTNLIAFTTQTVTTTSYTTSVTVTSTTASPDSRVVYTITAQAGALLFNNPSGSWADEQVLIIRIKDNGTARALTYGTKFRGTSPLLPTTTVINQTLYEEYIYNSTDDKYDLAGFFFAY